MAEVLAPVGASSTITMLHSAPDAFQTSQAAQSHLASAHVSQINRSHMYNPQLASLGYRGSSVPVSPYAFQSTPHLRHDNRTHSAPSGKPVGQALQSRHSLYDSSSTSTASSSGSSHRSFAGNHVQSKDDSLVGIRHHRAGRPEDRNSMALIASLSTPDLSLPSFETVKPSPDRYRRASRRFDNLISTPQPMPQSPESQQRPSTTPNGAYATAQASKNASGASNGGSSHNRHGSVDEASASRNSARYRRRSLGNMETIPTITPVPASTPTPTHSPTPTWSQIAAGPAGRVQFHQTPALSNPSRPTLQHMRASSASAEVPRPSSSRRPSSARQASTSQQQRAAENRPTTAPSSGMRQRLVLSKSTPDFTKRLSSPSPLSKPIEIKSPEKTSDVVTEPSVPEQRPASSSMTSPAVKKLTALKDTENVKKVKSKLRRVLSFGSAQELRRGAVENSAAERAKMRKAKFEQDQEAQDAIVAARQEAAGIGAGIYTHQTSDFTGSTDNISISSTASSASIMLRKVGQGMMRSTRSIKNLFRPKSVIGAPAADIGIADDAATTGLTRITIEAERELVNVNVDPHDKPGGGTGFPHLERNSMDAADGAERDGDGGRRTILGGERERAEVLAAVRKGILKRTATAPSNHSAVTLSDVPLSENRGSTDTSAPSTPDGKASSEPGNSGVMIAARIASSSTKSLPNTGIRNISFNSRVQFHDVWSSSEYDRRGDIATCNRLTPMLAQQIKEELNAFKMEMEVHEASKPHTHFF